MFRTRHLPNERLLLLPQERALRRDRLELLALHVVERHVRRLDRRIRARLWLTFDEIREHTTHLGRRRRVARAGRCRRRDGRRCRRRGARVVLCCASLARVVPRATAMRHAVRAASSRPASTSSSSAARGRRAILQNLGLEIGWRHVAGPPAGQSTLSATNTKPAPALAAVVAAADRIAP